MKKNIRNNQLISKIFSRLSEINEQNTFKNEFKLFFTVYCKKSLKTGSSTETDLAKVCWKKLSEFNDTLIRWKIINNVPFYFHGIKSKKDIWKLNQ